MRIRSPWVDAWHLDLSSRWPPGVLAALERTRGVGKPPPACTTWRVPAVGRAPAGGEARARTVVVAATTPGPDPRRPKAPDRPDTPPERPDARPAKRHPAARHDDPHRLPDDPVEGFETLDRLDPYDPYDAFDRSAVEPHDLVDRFAQAVEAAGGACHPVTGDIPDSLLDRLVADLDAWQIVFSDAPEEGELAQRLRHRGAEVAPATPERAVVARVGLTRAVAGIADRGTVVVDTGHERGRLAAVLPPVQLCVVPAERLVATTADALRQLSEDDGSHLPASLTVMAGPDETDRSGKPLTRRTHRPAALHVVVVRQGC